MDTNEAATISTSSQSTIRQRICICGSRSERVNYSDFETLHRMLLLSVVVMRTATRLCCLPFLLDILTKSVEYVVFERETIIEFSVINTQTSTGTSSCTVGLSAYVDATWYSRKYDLVCHVLGCEVS